MSIAKATRLFCLTLLLGALVANPAKPAMATGATPDVPFVDDLTRLQPVIVTNLSHIHIWLAEQPCRYYKFDETYDSLAAEVNGFLFSLAGDIRRNNFHESTWQAQATSIVDELKKFNDLLAQTQTSIEANSLPPPALNCPYGALHSSSGPPGAPPKPGFSITLPLNPADFGKMLDEAQNRRISGLSADTEQRAQFADTIMQSQWPQECQLNLQGKKLPCLNPMPAPSAKPTGSP